MRKGGSGRVARQFRTLFGAGSAAGKTDEQLLSRFAERSAEAAEAGLDSEAAFAALVARHGPMVLGVCRRALADPHDADDAFQAVFLILAMKARRVRVGDSLGRWLYGVSRRVAARARSRSRKHRATAEPGLLEALAASGPDPSGDLCLREAIDEELERLPLRYRMPVLLCHLEGLTHEEAARRLCWPVGTLSGRLSRARALLRDRLARRGLAPTLVALAGGRARAAVPTSLHESTVQAAVATAARRALEDGAFPASAAALAEGVSRAMIRSKLTMTAAALLSFAAVAAGAGALGSHGQRPAESGREPEAAPPEASGNPHRGLFQGAALNDCASCHTTSLFPNVPHLSKLFASQEPGRADRGFEEFDAAHGPEAIGRLRKELARLDAELDQTREQVRYIEAQRSSVARHLELLQGAGRKPADAEAVPPRGTPAEPTEAERLRELERKVDQILEQLGKVHKPDRDGLFDHHSVAPK